MFKFLPVQNFAEVCVLAVNSEL